VVEMVRVRLVNITKRFGETVAADRITLNIKEGEFFTLLGPSGCGKTTTLRIIAGFCKPDEGEIYFNDKLMNYIPPHKRNVGMVFQNYALWPHMTVFENVAFGLDVRKVPKEEKRRRVMKVLKMLGLEELADRYPGQLSGGQQQRVALARALVINPDVLLLDEPLSNLDAKLRIHTRSEIKKLQTRMKITTIYVTHDQEEALSISDRIAVMKDGKIQQVGTPLEIYMNPKNTFVADFIGITNFMEGTVTKVLKESFYEVDIGLRKRRLHIESGREFSVGDKVLIAVRPENIIVRKAPVKGRNCIKATVRLASYLGPVTRYEMEAENGSLLKVDIPISHGKQFNIGETVYLVFEPGKANMFKA